MTQFFNPFGHAFTKAVVQQKGGTIYHQKPWHVYEELCVYLYMLSAIVYHLEQHYIIIIQDLLLSRRLRAPAFYTSKIGFLCY